MKKIIAIMISLIFIVSGSTTVFAFDNLKESEEVNVNNSEIDYGIEKTEEITDIDVPNKSDKSDTEEDIKPNETDEDNPEEMSEDIIDLDNMPSFELDEETAEKMDQYIQEVEEQIDFSKDEISLDDVDMEALEEKYGSDIVQQTEENVEGLNEMIDEGEIEVTENGTIYETNDSDMCIQGKVNVTKGTTYWWGRIIYLSYTKAKKLRSSLKSNQKRLAIESLIISGGGLFNPLVSKCSFPYSGLAQYVTNIRNSIYKYNKSGKGIKYKIYWYGYYSMRTQGTAW